MWVRSFIHLFTHSLLPGAERKDQHLEADFAHLVNGILKPGVAAVRRVEEDRVLRRVWCEELRHTVLAAVVVCQ